MKYENEEKCPNCGSINLVESYKDGKVVKVHCASCGNVLEGN